MISVMTVSNDSESDGTDDDDADNRIPLIWLCQHEVEDRGC